MFYKKISVIIFAGIILAVLVAACSSGGSTVNNVTAVNLEATDSGCTPKTIQTAQGFLMKIAFKNSGSSEATFTVPDVPYTLTAPAGQTVEGNFTAPTKTGSYKFTCGSAANPTQGEIQVKSS